MAEAIVERAHIPTRFFCHVCNVEVNIINSDYICPLCSGGFVEELPAPSPTSSSSATTTSATPISGASADGGTTITDNSRRMNDLDLIRGEIATLLMSRNMGTGGVEISIDPSNRRGSSNILNLGNNSGSSTNGGIGSSGNGGGGGPRGRRRQQDFDRLDNVLLDFFHSISGDTDGPFGNSQMFFMGNPGDYAWGREGIDTIVTQLLNQMETSGPPPLAKDKIQEIPKVEVTEDEINNKLQCSVCWEDFRLKEMVRRLPCMHIYHENCIVPWLDLHGTCPICRKSLIIETNSDDTTNLDNNMTCPHHNNSNAFSVSGAGNSTNLTILNNPSTSAAASATNLPPLSAAASAGGASTLLLPPPPTTTATSSAGASTASQSNNIFAFDDGNVDYDFD